MYMFEKTNIPTIKGSVTISLGKGVVLFMSLFEKKTNGLRNIKVNID